MARTRIIAQVARYPFDMTDAELRATFGALSNSTVIRALILAEVAKIRETGDARRRTMRNLWYDYVKPILSRAGRLNDTTRTGKDVDWDGALSKYLAEMVREGVTTYAELGIVDGSRQRQPATTITQQIAGVTLVGAHFPRLILFTEKDTIWGEVEALASLYGVSAISGKGQPSAACTENTLETILARAAQRGQPVILLSLTDYDPAGYGIAESQYRQLQEAARERCEVYHRRLGLTPEQLTPPQRAKNAYTPKDDGLAEWYAATGGVDGRPLGLELDALPLEDLRAMFAIGIEEYVSLWRREEDLRRAFVDLLAWELLKPEIDARLDLARAAVWGNGLGARINQTQLPADLLRQAAIMGLDAIDPREGLDGQPLFDCAGEVREAMRLALQA